MSLSFLACFLTRRAVETDAPDRSASARASGEPVGRGLGSGSREPGAIGRPRPAFLPPSALAAFAAASASSRARASAPDASSTLARIATFCAGLLLPPEVKEVPGSEMSLPPAFRR